jgi:hypothetical protein
MFPIVLIMMLVNCVEDFITRKRNERLEASMKDGGKGEQGSKTEEKTGQVTENEPEKAKAE